MELLQGVLDNNVYLECLIQGCFPLQTTHILGYS